MQIGTVWSTPPRGGEPSFRGDLVTSRRCKAFREFESRVGPRLQIRILPHVRGENVPS